MSARVPRPCAARAPWVGVLGALWAGAGCAPQEVDPAPKAIEVVFFSPEPVDAGAPRAALAWVGPEAAEVVADAPLVDGAVWLPLAPPPEAIRLAFRPIEPLRFTEPEQGRPFAAGFALRPRVVVYDDRDRDGRFDLPPPFGDGADRVLAVDRGTQDGLAWSTNIDAILDSTPLSLLDTLYARLGGVLSPFVRTRGAPDLEAIPWQSTLVLDADETQLVTALFACPRFEVFGVREGRQQLLVDPELPLSLACDPTCRDVAFPLRGPDRTPPSALIPMVETCDDDGQVAVYEANQAGVACVGCLCAFIEHRVTAVARPDALPDWWPCGEGDGQIPLCEGCGLSCSVRDCGGPAPAP